MFAFSYLRNMSPARQRTTNGGARGRTAGQRELLVRPRRSRRTVAFQWYDGAGELHYQELSPAQSWPYLQRH